MTTLLCDSRLLIKFELFGSSMYIYCVMCVSIAYPGIFVQYILSRTWPLVLVVGFIINLKGYSLKFTLLDLDDSSEGLSWVVASPAIYSTCS